MVVTLPTVKPATASAMESAATSVKPAASATVQAEIASVAYELRADAFERLKTERPPLTQALCTFMIGVMAERLSFASKAIGVLQR